MELRSESKLMFRALADTMPAVTVEVRLKGLPTAKTHSPILSSSEFPIGMAAKLVPSILRTAISVEGSVPTTFASYLELSFKITWISLALSMT